MIEENHLSIFYGALLFWNCIEVILVAIWQKRGGDLPEGKSGLCLWQLANIRSLALVGFAYTQKSQLESVSGVVMVTIVSGILTTLLLPLRD